MNQKFETGEKDDEFAWWLMLIEKSEVVPCWNTPCDRYPSPYRVMGMHPVNLQDLIKILSISCKVP